MATVTALGGIARNCGTKNQRPPAAIAPSILERTILNPVEPIPPPTPKDLALDLGTSYRECLISPQSWRIRALVRRCHAVEALLDQFKTWLKNTQEQGKWEVLDLWKRLRFAEVERDRLHKAILEIADMDDMPEAILAIAALAESLDAGVGE